MCCQFLCQSAEKACEYMVNAVNVFLTEFREKIKDMTDDEFKQQVEAIKTGVAEKDINLSKENERFWGEISVHKYGFTRQQIEIEELQTITK